MNAQDAPLPEASAQMMQMITGYWITQLTHGMARYSIADHLAEGPKGAQEIAAAEGLNPDACFRFLRACAGLGLVSHDGARFGRTPLSDTLRRGVPGSLRGFALSQPAPGHWLPWGRFPEALKTGEMQTVPALGDPLFDYYGRAPDEAQSFTDAMTGLTMMVAAEAARLIDTSGTALAVDIGGAGGALIMALLDANPRLHGIVFDRPNIVPSVAAMAERAGLQDRVTAVGGDFFEAVPAADLYLLKFILHDWDDALCVKILKSCRQAARPGARLAVIELAVGEIGTPSLAPLMDLNMMVMSGGRERSEAEYAALFAAAGWSKPTLTPTNSPMVILEAR